jgi:hypothetical protein
LAVGLERQHPIAIDDESVVEQADDNDAARLEVAEPGAGDQGEQRRLPGVGVEGLLTEPRRGLREEEERDTRGDRPGAVEEEVGRDHPAEDQLEVRDAGDDRQVLPERLEGRPELEQRLLDRWSGGRVLSH